MRKNILLTVLTAMLAVGLLVVTVFYQRYSDAEMLAHLATLPPYTGTQKDTVPTLPEQTKAPTLSDAPNVKFYDSAGNQVQLSDFKGKPVVINFWASWVSSTKAEFSIFGNAQEAYQDKIHFLMINVTDGTLETKETARQYWESLETKLPVYYDTDADAATGFRVKTAPATFFINAEGKSVAYAPGALTRADLEQGIRMCMNSQ